METNQPSHKVSADTLRSLAIPTYPATGNRYKIIESTLRNAIIDGSLQPGYRLTQQAIAEAFDVSRMPVREALKGLHMQGYILADRYKSYVVAAGIEAAWAGDLTSLLRAVGEHYSRLDSLEAKTDFGNQVLNFMKSIAC